MSFRLPSDEELAGWERRRQEAAREAFVAAQAGHGTGRVETDAQVSDDPEDREPPMPDYDEPERPSSALSRFTNPRQYGKSTRMSTGQCVAFIDDNQDYCDLLARVFRTQAPELVTYPFQIGHDALEHLGACGKSFPIPALLLVDRMIPGGVDGFGIIRAVRGLPALAAMPIYMLSATHEAEHVERARSLGADGYLGKTDDDDNVVGLVRRILARRPWVREESVRSLCAAPAPAVPLVDIKAVSVPPAPPADQSLVTFTAACAHAQISVRRALALHETDTILDAKRRVVVRYLMAAGWSNLEVQDFLPFARRYLQERRGEKSKWPSLPCASRALAFK